jgi:glycosyltransferase involved in cell wall biosynthesis
MKQNTDSSPPELSVVVPFFNEAGNLRPLVEEIRRALEPKGTSFEILLVDDASTDEGPGIVRTLASGDERIRLVCHTRNLGQSAALVSGFERVRAPVVVTLDADLQNDPGDIPRLLAALPGFDVVCGVRAERHDNLVRRISSRIANSVRNRVTSESITDVGCSLRVCRTEFLRHLPAFNGMHRFLPTLLRLDGARVRELNVSHRPRRHGESKYGVSNRLWRGIVDLFGVRWLQARWIDRRASEEIGLRSDQIPASETSEPQPRTGGGQRPSA